MVFVKSQRSSFANRGWWIAVCLMFITLYFIWFGDMLSRKSTNLDTDQECSGPACVEYRNAYSCTPRRYSGAVLVCAESDGLISPIRVRTGAEILQEEYASRIIVSEKNRFVYCPVPKVANSNWKYLIRKLEGFDDYPNLTIAHRSDLNGLRYLSDYSAEEIEKLLSRDSGFFKFTFVRDPYSRLLSGYLDKFQNKDPQSEEYRLFTAQVFSWKYIKNKNLSSEPRISFRVFVDELLKQDPTKMNLHWMPQSHVCGIGDIPYDFVGRLERIKEESKIVLASIGHHDEVFPTQEQIGFPSSGTSYLLNDFYTLELMLKARLLYEVDFSTLGY